MKTMRKNALLMGILLFFTASLGAVYPFACLVFCMGVWLKRTKRFTLVLAVALVLVVWRVQPPRGYAKAGRIIEVKEKYAIVSDGINATLVYDPGLLLDSKVRIDSTPKEIEGTKGFFHFDFRRYCRQKGVAYSADDCVVEKQGHTLRSLMQRRIASVPDETQRALMMKVLLGIKSDALKETYLYDNGFSIAVVIVMLERILKYFLDEVKVEKTVFSLLIALGVLYHFPMMIVQRLVFRILGKLEMEQFERSGIGLSIVIVLFPRNVLSASFLFPAVYRLCALSKGKGRLMSFPFMMILSSVMYQGMNPVKSLLFPVNMMAGGISVFLCFLMLAFPFFPLSPIVLFLDSILGFFDFFNLPGSMVGLGLPYFALLAMSLRKHRHREIIFTCLLLLFQAFGLCHPFASVTFVNVGQGDSILVRQPFNTCNILVDTGKPAQWNTLQSMLDGMGVRRLDTMIISHGDDDHSGNMDRVIQKYRPHCIVTSHHEPLPIGKLLFYDLNPIENEDENQSCIMDFFSMNGIAYVLTGDGDVESERQILQQGIQLDNVVLKAGHHGSKTSSSEDFLNALQPRLAVISCGAYELYRHPSPDTLQRLMQRHLPYLTTREDGDIEIICLPFINLLVTSSGKIAIISTS